MAAGLQLKFTNMAITSKRLVRYWPNLAEITNSAHPIGRYHTKFEFWNPRWPPAAILKNTKNAMSAKLFVQFSPNLNSSFVTAPQWQLLGQKRKFSKFKMAAGLQLKFTNMRIAWKRLVRNWPNLAGITHSARPIGKYHKFEFWNPRWPPAAILKNTKKAISSKPFVRFSPNLNWSDFWVKNEIFQNARWPPGSNWNVQMAITSKRLVQNWQNLAGITHSARPIGKHHKNFEFWNPRWPPLKNKTQ